MKLVKTLCSLLVAASLLFGAALADVKGVDDMLAASFDVNRDTRMRLGFQVKTLLPYDEAAVSMVNAALGHISMDVALNGDDEALAMIANGQTVMTFAQKKEGNGFSLTTSLLPNRTLTGAGDGLEALFGQGGEQETAFDLSEAVTQSESCYKELAEAIVPYAEEKAANYKIAGIGYAKWVRLARLSAEDSAAILPQLTKLLSCGMDSAFANELQGMTCKKGLTVALYRVKEGGADVAMYVKGNVSLGEGDSRTLSYVWAFNREEGSFKDSYKLELIKAAAPVNRRIIEATSSQIAKSGKLTLSIKSSVLLRTPKGATEITEKTSLESREKENGPTLTGSMLTTTKQTAGGETTTTSVRYEPDLALTSAEGSGVLSGTVNVVEKKGTKPVKELVITLDENPAKELAQAVADDALYAVDDTEDAVTITIGGSSLDQNAGLVGAAPNAGPQDYLVGKAPLGVTAYAPPAAETSVALDGASPEELEALRGELFQNAAGVLLRALAALPAEANGLLRDNMTDVSFNAFLDLISGI